MYRIILTLLSIYLISTSTQAQKVGLVLSGGGAKGLTHVGVIRALEENHIPIDYIAGTSMGAIVGSLYAMGYSPDEMTELLKSDDFKRWSTGEVEQKHMYYFKKNLPTPELINIRLNFKDSINFKPQILPTSFVDPIQMNLVFMRLYASATAASKANFDSLFIPFRCIASDIYNKKQIISRNGDLGDAVRASMTFPFMFKPIELNGQLAYDGGIYNNFPADIVREDFKPDIIIGSVVAGNPVQPKENNIMSQLENMIMQKSDYTIADDEGIIMRFKYSDVNLMDFHRTDELSTIGYDRTIGMMDSIKSRIARTADIDSINQKRVEYKNTLPNIVFKNIYIEGANFPQQAYIRKEFHSSGKKEFSYEDLQRGYFRLLSGNMISEIIPHAVYNPSNESFDLYLKVKMEDNLSIRVGGNVSTMSSNQIYLGISYQNLNNNAKEISIDGHLGQVYNNFQMMGKIDLPTNIPTSFRFIASWSSFDYLKNNKLFSSHNKPAFNKKNEKFIKLSMSVPFLQTKRAEFGIGGIKIEDKYFQSSVIDFEKDKYDRSKYKLFGGTISFNGSTLNTRQYATQGTREALVAQIVAGKEYYYPAVITDTKSRIKDDISWLQLSYMKEQYHKLSSHWIMGWYIKALYASKNFSENYTATMMQAAEFAPTTHSQLVYNEAFRANQFIGAGIRPIFRLNQLFFLRGEFYGFLPIFPIESNPLNKAYYGKAFSRFEYIGEITAVCQLPFGAIGAYVNHYSSPKKDWNIGLTLGLQLFNYRFFE